MWPTVNVHISHTHNHTHTPMRARALGGATMWYMRTFTQHQLTDWHNINKYEEYKNKKTWFECSGKHHTTHTPQTITKVNWKQRTRVSRWWIVESFRSMSGATKHSRCEHNEQTIQTRKLLIKWATDRHNFCEFILSAFDWTVCCNSYILNCRPRTQFSDW